MPAGSNKIGQPFTGHTNTVRSVAFSPDGKHIVSGSWDNTICIWDAETGKQVGDAFQGYTDSARSVHSCQMEVALSRARVMRRCGFGMWERGSRLVSHSGDIQIRSGLLRSHLMVSVSSRARMIVRCAFGMSKCTWKPHRYYLPDRFYFSHTHLTHALYSIYLTLYDIILPTLHVINLPLYTLCINAIILCPCICSQPEKY